VELRAFYERSYSRGGPEGEVYADWRAVSAVTKAEHVLALTGAIGDQPARVLDVGCGDGAVIAALSARRPRWTFSGVEIAQRAVALASDRCPGADIRLYDGERLPYEAGEFELAIVSHVLEHVSDPVAVLSEAARVSPRVLVEVPLEANISARRAAKRGIAAEVGHIQRFSRAGVARVVSDAGLQVMAERSDPLGREVHTFFADSPGASARGHAKWLLRRTIHGVSGHAAQRLFTVHYACLCERSAVR
jgi:SAM-dependent methyltransferase